MLNFTPMNTEFTTWLDQELRKKKWTRADLARHASYSQATLSLVFSNDRAPSIELCYAIARALDLPAEMVFRAAGLLPPRPQSEEAIERGKHILENYKYPETKARALEYLEFLRTQEDLGNYDKPPDQKKKHKNEESLTKALGA